MGQQLNLLLSGPGLIGRQHARLVLDHPGCNLAAIVAPPSAENAEFAKSAGVELFETIEAAFAAHKIDGALISSPNAFHAEQVQFCIKQRVPTFVEKPMTDKLETAYALVELSEKAGVPVLVGHHRTYNPLIEAAKRFLNAPEFGKPVALQGSALFHKPAHYFVDGPWRTKIGGGPILINLIHEVGLMRSFFGEIVSVFADATNATRGFEVEDSVAITVRFANSAIGTFILSDIAASNKSWEMASGENPSYPHYPSENCYHFSGTNGSLDFPTMKFWHYNAEKGPSWWVPFERGTIEYTKANPLERQFAHFVDVIVNKAAPKVSARDGYRNMLVIEAIRASILQGRMVRVAEVSL
jgi:predicted dehydrogenase